MAGPKLFRNTDVTDSKGQFKQEALRYWEQIKTRAYSAIQSFAEFAQLETIASVDSAADYLVIYDASEGVANKVLVEDVVPTADTGVTLIETISATAGSSIVIDDIPGTYRDLIIRWSGIAVGSPSSSDQIDAEFSTNNGSTYATGIGSGVLVYGGSTTIVHSGPNSVFIGRVNNAADNNGFVILQNYAAANTVPKPFWGASENDASVKSQAMGHLFGVGAIDAIRLSLNNWTANGTLYVYGVN